jgi:hypothetical protein
MQVVLRTFLQIPNASIGKPPLMSVAIISLAAIAVLVAVSFRNQLTEEELIGAVPTWPPAGPIEVQPTRPLSASTAAVPPGDAETIKGSSGAFRELIPSPRPRPMHKPRPRQAHKIRSIPDNVLPILLAGCMEVQPVRPVAALTVAPHADDAETAVQGYVIREQGSISLPVGAADIQLVGSPAASTTAPSAGDAETAMGSSGASRELVPSPRPRPAQKSRPRQPHNIRNRSNYSVATLPPAGPTEIPPMRPLSTSTAALPAGDAETATQSSGVSRKVVPPPPPRRADKSHLSRARHMRNRSNSGVPPAGRTEVQPMRPLAGSTDAAPAGHAQTAMQSSEVSREAVPSPPQRRADKSHLRRARHMRNRSNSGVPPGGPTRPLPASTAALPAGDAEMALQSSGASREVVPSPPSRRMDKSHPRRARQMRNRSNSGALPASAAEVQAMPLLAASTTAPSAGDAETAMGSSGASRELVPSPRPRPVHKARLRQTGNMRDDADIIDAVTILKDLRDPSQIDRAVRDNPSNVFLLLMAEIRRASHETGRLIEKLIDEIEPPTLPKELNYARASRAQLEAYRLDLQAAEANAMAALSRYVALLESEREKVEVLVRSLDVDDRYIRAALSGIDKRQAQSTDLMSKMLSANAEFYRATAGYVAFLIEQFEQYKVSTNGRFMFSSQSIADRYDGASEQINDAIKRISELEEERKNLAQFQQERWERFASGN